MNNYVFVSSRRNIKEYINGNFNNTFFVHNIPYFFEINRIIKFIKKNSIEQIIFEDYIIGFEKLLEKLSKFNLKVKVVWTKSLPTLNSDIELDQLLMLVALLKNQKIHSLAFTDNNLFEVYKETKGVTHISYTVTDKANLLHEQKKLVGIYGQDNDWRSNYFNQISAVKFLDDFKINTIGLKRVSKKYCRLFNIKYNNRFKKLTASNFRKSIIYNEVNSMVEFSNRSDLYIIDSFNSNVPCVVGNNSLFFNNTKLGEMVIVKSDDDINEIASKLQFCIKNRSLVMKEYHKLKKEYDKQSKESIEKFIEE